MSTECLFCKIAQRIIPATIIYEDEYVFALNDINPQAPQHLLVIPKQHIATVNEINTSNDANLLGHMLKTAKNLAESASYRLVMNCNAEAGQSVFHIHLHLLSGRAMQWPPG